MMRPIGSAYKSNGQSFVGLYVSGYPDVYFALPRNMNGRHTHHVTYGYQNKTNSIDIHAVDKLLKMQTDYKRTIEADSVLLTDQEVSDIFKRQNVRIESVSDMKGTMLEKNLFKILASDIGQFCKNPAKTSMTDVQYVPVIVPVTKIKYSNVANPVTSGKADFNYGCVLDGNVDCVTANADCIATFIPGKNASYSNGLFTGYYVTADTACTGCYAERNHLEPYPKRFTKLTVNRLVNIFQTGNFPVGNTIFGQHMKVVRLGKRTDTGAIFNREQLYVILEACIKAKTKPVMPTKFLEFDKDVANLFKRAKGSLIYSKTDLYYPDRINDYEFGPIQHGFDWKSRLGFAEEYARAGVNTSIYLMTDIVYDKKQGFFDMLNGFLSKGLDIQILDAKITRKDVAETITGRTWEDLKGKLHTISNGALFGEESFRRVGGYKYAGNKLVPKHMNPVLEKLVEDNHGRIRACSSDAKMYCGTCFIYKGFIKEIEKKELVKIPKYKKRKKDLQMKIVL